MCASRTTSIYDVVRAPRTMSYGYDVVRARHKTSCATSVLYDVVRLTYDIVRRQESRWPQPAASVTEAHWQARLPSPRSAAGCRAAGAHCGTHVGSHGPAGPADPCPGPGSRSVTAPSASQLEIAGPRVRVSSSHTAGVSAGPGPVGQPRLPAIGIRRQ
jgi:hypothetical protein